MVYTSLLGIRDVFDIFFVFTGAFYSFFRFMGGILVIFK